jgi:alpha-glucosidase
MQWDASPNAGFAPPGVEPWLPVAAGHDQRNVGAQSADPRSELALFRALTALRREHRPLHLGSLRLLGGGAETLAYVREHEDERVLVALHFGATPVTAALADAGADGEVLLSTELDRGGAVDLATLDLRPREGVVARLR